MSTGIRGASITVGRRGVYGNVGVPGTGLSYREKLSNNKGVSKAYSEPSVSSGKITVQLELQDDGKIIFTDGNGNELPPKYVRELKSQKGDAVLGWLEEQCLKINGGFEDIVKLHMQTPSPSAHLEFTPEEFPETKPKPPILKKPGLIGSLFKSIVARYEKENKNIVEQYDEKVNLWKERKNVHDVKQEKKRKFFEVDRLNKQGAMEKFLEERFSDLEWPRETLINFQIEENGAKILLDVDLPEIEDMPQKFASITAKGLRLKIKALSDKQIREEYMTHIHSVGFRIIGETFISLPKCNKVVLSAYSQRSSRVTANIDDEYLYSLRVSRDDWSKINFNNLEAIDLIECLGSFEIRRQMTKTGIFKPVEPYDA